MRVKVPGDKRFVTADGIDPGRPILHSSEEWMDRTRRASRVFELGHVLIFGLILLPILVLMFVSTGNPGAIVIMLVLMATCIFPPVAVILVERRYLRRQERHGTPSGLYTNGILFRNPSAPVYLFIPYGSMTSIERGSLGERRFLKVGIRGWRSPFYADLLRLLDEDDLTSLGMAMKGGYREPEGPPELHVYGGRGASIRSIPRDGKGPSG
jgi:hypothetical protein